MTTVPRLPYRKTLEAMFHSDRVQTLRAVASHHADAIRGIMQSAGAAALTLDQDRELLSHRSALKRLEAVADEFGIARRALLPREVPKRRAGRKTSARMSV